MKVYKLEKWLYVTVMLFALVFITTQVSFAVDELSATAQAEEESSDREFGILEVRAPYKETRSGLVDIEADKNVEVFAALTSNKVVVTKEVLVERPFLKPALSYLYVSFRVKSAMAVTITWEVDLLAPQTFTTPTLSTSKWYNAYYHPTLIGLGAHSVKIIVKKAGIGGDTDKMEDSCNFFVVP